MEPPHARLQNAERTAAECQCTQERADRQLAEATVFAEKACQDVMKAKELLEEERHALVPQPVGAALASLPQDFYDELSAVKAAAQWGSQGSVAFPYHMLAAFSHIPPPKKGPDENRRGEVAPAAIPIDTDSDQDDPEDLGAALIRALGGSPISRPAQARAHDWTPAPPSQN